MAQTRAEHLAWCKQRAMVEYDSSGQAQDAMASIISDLGKHPETRDSAFMIGQLGLGMSANGMLKTRQQVKEFIDGIN